MKVIGNLFSLLTGLALIAAFVLGAYLGIKYFLGLYKGLDQQLEAVLTIATIVVLLVAAVIASSIRASKQQENNMWLAKEKSIVYDHLIQKWTEALRKTEKNRENASNKSGEETDQINRNLLLLTNSNVLNRFVSLNSMEQKFGFEDEKVQAEIGRMLLEFRRDLGRKNRNLKEKDLLELIRDRGHHVANSSG